MSACFSSDVSQKLPRAQPHIQYFEFQIKQQQCYLQLLQRQQQEATVL
jgi:hypothetical protein